MLLAGLAMFGVGSGCMLTPVSWSAVHSLNAAQAARSSMLFHVNHNTAASVGVALMSMILASRVSGRTGTEISGAYVGAFAVALVLIAATAIPAWFLPRRAAAPSEINAY